MKNSGKREINENLEFTLSHSGSNRKELERFLALYSKKSDSLKLKAAEFLVENLVYHEFSNDVNDVDPIFFKKVDLADSLYYELVKGKTYNEINIKAVSDSVAKISKYIKSLDLNVKDLTRNNTANLNSIENITFEALKEQLETSFHLRQTTPLVSKLSFTEFCEFVLPFQARFGRNIRLTNRDLNKFIKKYINPVGSEDLSNILKLYRVTISNFRKILGNYPLHMKIGFEEVLFSKVPGWDCFDVTNYATAFLNSIGIPSAAEYNISYKMLPGKHSVCVILDEVGHYSVFSPEGEDYYPKIMTGSFEQYNGWMNMYRIHYSPRENTPVFLKKENEYIPPNLANPLIEDVTSKRIETLSMNILFNQETSNNLVYLASFSSTEEMIPVTWAEIDKNTNQARFENVIPNRLYFPIYYEGKTMKVFARPFMMVKDSLNNGKYIKRELKDDPLYEPNEIILTRKYPRKEKMVKIAKQLIGTVIIGTNDPTFKSVDTLYVLDFELKPHLQDIDLNNDKTYKYFRITAPSEFPHLNISEFQLLSKASLQYKNTASPHTLPIFHPKDTTVQNIDFVWLLTDSLNKMIKRPEYDGNMSTAPSAYRSLTLRLNEPQIVSKIRLAALNANNGIVKNDIYMLYIYDHGKWIPIAKQAAKFNYLRYENLSYNALYWLKNLSTGKEELPFTIDNNGEQHFIYFN
ncbi:hypothetical protein [Sphingobacterium sp.]|uniref:hypothetical protein n=1 Tax=Sphingobacterium sp. TaxID=341027 RepID=UPI002589EFBE|nr:hypothetical protein [Sphingobacterium sp.]WET69020.1 MAG: hypothetical protein P0Y57_24565 [Sphingobacterium sp.]